MSVFALYYTALSETQTSYWSFIEIQLSAVVTHVSPDEVNLKTGNISGKKALWVLDANFYMRTSREEFTSALLFSINFVHLYPISSTNFQIQTGLYSVLLSQSEDAKWYYKQLVGLFES